MGAALISSIVFIWVDEGAPETIARAQAAIEEAEARAATIEGLQSEFVWITRLYTVAIALREYAETVFATGAGSAHTREQRLGAMLDTLLAEKATLLLVNDEAWNFAINLYDPAVDELRCDICRRPSRSDELAPHRSWKPGEGHVGKAFWLNQELVAPDTSEASVATFFDAPDAQRKGDDRTRYCSTASLPIRIQGERPLGVPGATSDKIGRYQPLGLTASVDNVEPLRGLSASIAMVLSVEQLQAPGEPVPVLSRPKGLPLSEAAQLDDELGERISRISAGKGTSTDVSETSRLIRKRASLLMPKVFRNAGNGQFVTPERKR